MPFKAQQISLERVKELFYYDDDGNLYRKVAVGNSKKDSKAGWTSGRGYLSVSIDGKTYRTHRVLYSLYHNMEIPTNLQIDHIDGNKTNNRKDNLRLVTNQENQFSKPKVKGFTYKKHAKKFEAKLKLNGKDVYLGLYDTELDARAAYLRAKEKHHTIEDRQCDYT